MGGRESKPYSVPYEDAVKRVSETELHRLKSAYKRTAIPGGSITGHSFAKEVLGEAVPHQLAQQIFVACGGSTKGISFKDLLCSIVLLTKGNTEEKIKFIFSVYSNDSGSHVLRTDLQRCLQATEGVETGREIVRQCMGQRDRLTYEEFKQWLQQHPEATSITRWLLCSSTPAVDCVPSDSPSFYQRLAGVTHLEESDILELEKCYWTLKSSSTSELCDLNVLGPLLSPPLTPTLVRGLFNAFDENRDGHIDFKEMACGISAACRGPQTERQKFLFKIFDKNRDGVLCRDELSSMVASLLALNADDADDDGVVVSVSEERVESIVNNILLKYDSDDSQTLSLQDYLIWTLDNSLTSTLLTIVFQICHVVLGLRPSSPHEEGEIVMDWRQRSLTRPFTIGHFWYVVNSSWWLCWTNYVTGQGEGSTCGSPSSLPSSGGSRCATLRRSKLHKKTAVDSGSVAHDYDCGVTVRSVSSLSTLSMDDALSVGVNDCDVSNCWEPVSITSRSSSVMSEQHYGDGGPAAYTCVEYLNGVSRKSSTDDAVPLSRLVQSEGSCRGPQFCVEDCSAQCDGAIVFNNISVDKKTAGAVNAEHKRTDCLGTTPAVNASTVTKLCNGGPPSVISEIDAGSKTSIRSTASLLQLHPLGLESARSTPYSTPSPSPCLSRRKGGNGRSYRPPAIDNSVLVEPVPSHLKGLQLTWEGGRLIKRVPPLKPNEDFVLLPEALWKALHRWYGGGPALPRQMIHGVQVGSVELELYPITLHIYKHVPPRSTTSTAAVVGGAATHWMGVMGGYGVAAFGKYADPSYLSSLTGSGGGMRRQLAHVAAFSCLSTLRQVYQFLGNKLKINTDDMRLWLIVEDGLMLLEECMQETLATAGVTDMSDILLEVRNSDLTWPEEISQIRTAAQPHYTSVRQNSIKAVHVERGVTGLSNLGNTCFLNAAIQCCSNTSILTSYFLRNLHLYELNTENKCGTGGNLAREYGNLLHQLWGGEVKSIAPLKLRFAIGQYSSNFTGAEQHDSQELLAFLLDRLHEDLNRVQHKPYTELKDSEGRPDTLVAQEAWENHIVRNKSIIVDLFHGQLKSKVTCSECGHQSARFDPFTYLSLPLPMESYTHLEVIVVRLDGSVPCKYGLRLIEDSKFADVKTHLQTVTGIAANHLLLVDLSYQMPQIKLMPADQSLLGSNSGYLLYAYELPTPLLQQGSSSVSSAQRSSSSRTRQKSPHGRPTSATNVAEYVKLSHQSIDSTGEQREVKQRLQHSEGRSSARDRQILAEIQRTTGATHSVLQSLSVPCDSGDHLRSVSPDPGPASLTGDDLGLQTPELLTCPVPPSPPPPSVVRESDLGKPNKGFLVAYHRKLIRQDVYFLSSQQYKPSLFGFPLIVPCCATTTHKDLYQSVWTQVSRLVTPLPPSEGNNHAADCDDSLGYEFPFVLCLVEREGMQCALCPWYQFCRGCHLPCDDEVFPAHSVSFLAIDWDLTALHLRYQSKLEKNVLEDSSVQEQRWRQTEPISLKHCLEAYTADETLDYSCERCKAVHPATKKLQIWRLPPILIVHLKRFQFVGNRWIKSQQIVNFPLHNFDPTQFLASVPRETLLLHQAAKEGDVNKHRCSLPVLRECEIHIDNEDAQNKTPDGDIDVTSNTEKLILCNGVTEDMLDGDDEVYSNDSEGITINCTNSVLDESILRTNREKKKRVRNGSVLYGDTPQDFHQHLLEDDQDPLTLTYDLYAIVCHSGIMEAGHYVCYAKNAKGKWICFNDSSCKEVSEQALDFSNAYLLFYERRGLDVSKYLRNLTNKVPHPVVSYESDVDSEMRKQCSVM